MNDLASNAIKNAIPWSIVLGVSPFLFMSAEAYFTAKFDREQVKTLRASVEDMKNHLIRIESQTKVNQALIEKALKTP
jgi:hypothetical protein